MGIRTFLMISLATVSLAACGGKGKGTTTTTGDTKGSAAAAGSLYDRLGGKDAITAVVDDFVGNVAGDKRINAFFANADIPGLKQKLVDQICSATGGPCTYGGKDMKTAHQGMGVKEADFNALVEDLVKSLDKFKVGEKEKADLLGALGGMKGDIVGH
jgi:hemoglobin